MTLDVCDTSYSPSWFISQLEIPVPWHWFIGKQLAEQRHKFVRAWAHHQKLGDRAIRERILHVIGKDTGAMWDNRNVISSCHRDDFSCLSQATHPINVWLENVCTFARDQFAKAIARVLMFAGCHQADTGQR